MSREIAGKPFPALRTGWILVVAGWLLPVIPLVGLVGLPAGALGGLVCGVIALTRNQERGGLLLLLTALIAAPIVGVVWFLIYMAIGVALPFALQGSA